MSGNVSDMFTLKTISFSVILVGVIFQIAHAFFRVGIDPISTMLCVINAGCIMRLALELEQTPSQETIV